MQQQAFYLVLLSSAILWLGVRYSEVEILVFGDHRQYEGNRVADIPGCEVQKWVCLKVIPLSVGCNAIFLTFFLQLVW